MNFIFMEWTKQFCLRGLAITIKNAIFVEHVLHVSQAENLLQATSMVMTQNSLFQTVYKNVSKQLSFNHIQVLLNWIYEFQEA